MFNFVAHVHGGARGHLGLRSAWGLERTCQQHYLSDTPVHSWRAGAFGAVSFRHPAARERSAVLQRVLQIMHVVASLARAAMDGAGPEAAMEAQGCACHPVPPPLLGLSRLMQAFLDCLAFA